MIVRRDLLIWSAAAAGPLAWFGVLVAGYALTPDAYRSGNRGLLHAVHAVGLALALAGLAVAAREVRRRSKIEEDDVVAQRMRFVAWFALGLAAISVALVIASSLPTLLLIPGAEP